MSKKNRRIGQDNIVRATNPSSPTSKTDDNKSSDTGVTASGGSMSVEDLINEASTTEPIAKDHL